jgi:hypothetical protein
MNFSHTTTVAAALLGLATAVQAEGLVFNTPVTYTGPVTYAAGVTYQGAVSYAASATVSSAAQQPEPVLLDRVIVTPKGHYTEAEWRRHQRHPVQRYRVRFDSIPTPQWLSSLVSGLRPLH